MPLVEVYAVIVLPLLLSFTQYGARRLPAAVVALDPSEVSRRINPLVLPGVIEMNALRAPGAMLSRNITPALAVAGVPGSLATRATISPSPKTA